MGLHLQGRGYLAIAEHLDRLTRSDKTVLDQALRGNLTLEVGQTSEPIAVPADNRVWVARLDGKRGKPIDGMTPVDLQTLPRFEQMEKEREIGSKIFRGDSPWFMERFAVRYPELERREAEEAASKGESES